MILPKYGLEKGIYVQEIPVINLIPAIPIIESLRGNCAIEPLSNYYLLCESCLRPGKFRSNNRKEQLSMEPSSGIYCTANQIPLLCVFFSIILFRSAPVTKFCDKWKVMSQFPVNNNRLQKWKDWGCSVAHGSDSKLPRYCPNGKNIMWVPIVRWHPLSMYTPRGRGEVSKMHTQ